MTYKRVLLFSLFLIALVACNASASISYSAGGYLEVSNQNANLINLKDAYPSVVTQSGTIWTISAPIQHSGTGYVFLNNSEATEVRLYCTIAGDWKGLIGNNFKVENITFGGWNTAQNRYATKPYQSYTGADRMIRTDISGGGWFRNCILKGTYGILYTGNPDGDLYNITILNTSADGGQGAIDLENVNNIKVYDIYINNTEQSGVTARNCAFCEFYNITAIACGDYTDPKSGGYGIDIKENNAITACTNNCSFHDIYVDGTPWSGIGPGGQGNAIPYDLRFWNLTIKHFGHNGLDLHGGARYYVENVSVYHPNISSSEDNIYCTGKDVIAKNISSYADMGDHLDITIEGWSTNHTFENFSMYGDARGVVAFDTNNFTLINSTSNGAGNVYYLQNIESPATDTIAVDCDYRSGTVFLEDSRNGILENVGYGSINIGLSSTFKRYYYPNLEVKNLDGNPVSNAVVTVNTQGKNGYGKNQTYYFTDSNGKLYDNGNRTNWLSIIDTSNVGQTETSYTTQITVSKDGKTNSTNVNPSASWYSANPASLQAPETVLTLDVDEDEPETLPIIDTVHTFGDSYTSPITYNSDYAHKYISLVAGNHSWDIDPDCRDGCSIPDQVENVRSYYSSRGTGVVWNTGTGDSLYAHEDSPNGLNVYTAVLEDALAWLALPQDKKITGINFTQVSGTWEPAPLLYDNSPIVSETPGATIQANVTGDTVYLSYVKIARPGEKYFNLYLDNNLITTISCIGGQIKPTGVSEYAPVLYKFTGLSNTQHTVKIVTSSNITDYVIIDWVAGFDHSAITPHTTKVYVLNQPPHTASTYNEYGATLQDTIDIDSIIKNTIIHLNVYGLNISEVNVYPGYNAATMSGGAHDTLHPNDNGNIFMAAKLEQALVSPATLGLPPDAAFTSNKGSGTAPLQVTFTDGSTETPTSWAWDFDNDGDTDSTVQNPSHTFVDAGTYTVNLTATNEFGSDSVQHTITVSEGTGVPTPYTPSGYWIDAHNDVYVPINVTVGESISFNVSSEAGHYPNGTLVFPTFFDDFDNSSLPQWNVKENTGTRTVSNGLVDIAGTSGSNIYWLAAKTGGAMNTSLIYRATIPKVTSSPQFAQAGLTNGVTLASVNCNDFNAYPTAKYAENGNGATYDLHVISDGYFGNMSDYEIARTPTYTKYFHNGSLVYDGALIGTGTWYPHLAVRDSTFHLICDYMAIKQYTAIEPVVQIADEGTYKNVTITNTGSESLTGYQVKLNGTELGVASKTDSLAFEAESETTPTLNKIISSFINAYKNFMKNFGLHLTEAIWQTY
jgi:PKD repeat protein